MSIFSKLFHESHNTLPWLMLVGNPRAYRDCRPSATCMRRLYGESQETQLFENNEFGKLHDRIKTNARSGEARAQFVMGFLYDAGKYVGQNDRQAFDWYMLAANSPW